MLTILGTLDTAAVATVANLNGVYVNGILGVGATLTAVAPIALVVDGYPVAVGDRVLVNQQSYTPENGVYVVTDAGSGVTPWVLTRASDFDNSVPASAKLGLFIFVSNGTLNANTSWIMTATGTGVGTSTIFGTDAVKFTAAKSVLYSFAPGTTVYVVQANTFGVGIASVVGVTMAQTLTAAMALTYTVTYANTARASAAVSEDFVFPSLEVALAHYAPLVT